MRALLALMAVVGLLFTPMAAAAAQERCSHAGSEMAGMEMPMAQGSDDAKAAPDPCCDHGDKAPQSSKACAQACATVCSVVAPLPVVGDWSAHSASVRLVAVATLPLEALAPPRTERPPRSIV
ncbi:hypothetical protein [Phenylobacterium sp.]|uniref:hypothetical protein n=1 Tax=Phenylobacterium sp. TaxID=1871053 RepID=UPI003BA8D745